MRKYSALLILCLVPACGPDGGGGFRVCQKGDQAENGCGTCDCVKGRWDCPVDECPDLDFKAGFTEIEPVTFNLRLESDLAQFTSSRARLWYVFQPADSNPEQAPLVVLFNGGPGATTSGLLFSYNTGKKSLDPVFNGDLPVGDNPYSWTSFANLLYVDARGTGFSYGLMDHPEDAAARQAEFSVSNFNCLLDGADFVRVILRFLENHPSIRGNRVFILGESYGGVRATVISHLLLNYQDYSGSQNSYKDQALVDEIQAHFESLHPEYQGRTVPPEVVAGQFPGQILIQPLLSGRYESTARGQLWEQPGSVIHQIAAEEGLTYTYCAPDDPECRPVGNALDFVREQANRDVYNYIEPYNWTLEITESASLNLVMAEHLSEATGIRVSTRERLTAAGRTGAYRIGAPAALDPPLPPPPQGDLAQRLGELEEWDAYYYFTNDYISMGFYSDEAFRFEIYPGSRRFGEMFLENQAYQETFITQAAYDLMAHSPAQPLALSMHQDTLSGCQLDNQPAQGVARPGWMHLDYLPNAFGIPELAQRTIRFPLYAESGHVVTLNQPAELHDDVEEWMSMLP